jgi:DNA uptake protein ComE-like DNA-binding protein
MKLLQEAQRRGVQINFAQNNGDNVLGQYNPNNNTITVENNDLETMVETLAHELVHATTPENGNSLNEEYSAFVIGEQVAKEAGVDNNPHSADFWKNHVANSYSGLAKDNGIFGALNALGIAANDAQAAIKPAAQNAAAPTYGQAAAAAANITPQQAATDPFTSAMNQANSIIGGPQAAAAPAATADQANPLNQADPLAGGNQQLMQFIMMIVQMLMQMFGQMMGGMGQQQDPLMPQTNPLNPLNPVTPQATPQAAPAQRQVCAKCGGAGCDVCGGKGYIQQAQAPQHMINPQYQIENKQQPFMMTAFNITA